MDHRRITLDNPALSTLRYTSRSAAGYVRRPMHATTMSDVMAVRVTKPAAPAQMPTRPPVSQALTTPAMPQTQAVPLTVHPAPPATAPVPPKIQLPPQEVPVVEAQTKTKTKTKSWRINVSKKTSVLYAMAGVVFAVGLLVSLNGLRANRQVAAQVKQSQAQSEATADASHSAPSTVKPSDAAVRSYTVSPNIPRYLDIPKLKIHTRVLSEGVDRKNDLQVPWNIYDVGWYNASSQPGQNGAMLVDGHSGIGKTHGVFYKLATLTAGDPITVTRGDGKQFTYKVVKVQTVDANKVDMGSMLVSSDTSKPGLNLITCTGDIIPGTTELNKRVQVYAVMQ